MMAQHVVRLDGSANIRTSGIRSVYEVIQLTPVHLLHPLPPALVVTARVLSNNAVAKIMMVQPAAKQAMSVKSRTTGILSANRAGAQHDRSFWVSFSLSRNWLVLRNYEVSLNLNSSCKSCHDHVSCIV